MDKYLKETKMLNYSNANIQQLIRERRWKNINEFERLKSIYDFVRDEILFGYNIDDEHLCQYAKGIDRDMLDEIVDLLVETVCSARKTIRIAGDDYPAELVKSKLMKLNSSHIEFVFDCISKNTTEILISKLLPKLRLEKS